MARAGRLAQDRSWLIAGGVLLLILFGPGTYQLIHLSLMQRALDLKLAALSAEHARLEQEAERLQHDPAYVEGLIRSTFKVTQPGEYVVPIPDDTRRR